MIQTLGSTYCLRLRTTRQSPSTGIIPQPKKSRRPGKRTRGRTTSVTFGTSARTELAESGLFRTARSRSYCANSCTAAGITAASAADETAFAHRAAAHRARHRHARRRAARQPGDAAGPRRQAVKPYVVRRTRETCDPVQVASLALYRRTWRRAGRPRRPLPTDRLNVTGAAIIGYSECAHDTVGVCRQVARLGAQGALGLTGAFHQPVPAARRADPGRG